MLSQRTIRSMLSTLCLLITILCGSNTLLLARPPCFNWAMFMCCGLSNITIRCQDSITHQVWYCDG